MTESEVDITRAVSPSEPIGEDALKSILHGILTDRGAAAVLTCILADDTALRKLNREFRGIDAPTDVLSFDLSDPVHPAGETTGEIYISLEQARQQARETNRSFQEVVTHLAVHGVLHLLGFEHDTDAGHIRMQQQEAHYLAQLT